LDDGWMMMLCEMGGERLLVSREEKEVTRKSEDMYAVNWGLVIRKAYF